MKNKNAKEHHKTTLYLVTDFTDIDWVVVTFLPCMFICQMRVFPRLPIHAMTHTTDNDRQKQQTRHLSCTSKKQRKNILLSNAIKCAITLLYWVSVSGTGIKHREVNKMIKKWAWAQHSIKILSYHAIEKSLTDNTELVVCKIY